MRELYSAAYLHPLVFDVVAPTSSQGILTAKHQGLVNITTMVPGMITVGVKYFDIRP